jgi:predicted transcriptional regulator
LEGKISNQNDKVQAAADAANLVANAGVRAVAQAQKAGASVVRQVAHINAMPEASCQDADAILLEGAK